jgi:hypothetical protein
LNSSIYQPNIQPLQGCDIQFIVDRGLTPTVIQIVPLCGTLKQNKEFHSFNRSVMLNNVKFYRIHERQILKNKYLNNGNAFLLKDFLSLSVVHKPILQWQVSSFYWD